MSPAGQRLWSLIDAARRQVRRDGILAVTCTAGAALPFALLVAWVVCGGRWWAAPSPAPLIVVLLAIAGACIVAVRVLRRWVRGIDERVVAAAAEARNGLPPGSLRGVLELSRALPAGTSAALFHRAESELAMRLAGASAWDLAGEVGERARARRQRVLVAFAGLTAVTAALGFLSPERSREGWAPLLHPIAHLSPPPLPPLVVEPGDAEIARGSSLEIGIVAPGRREVQLRWRAAGDVPRQQRLEITSDRARSTIARVDAPLEYWVVAPDGAVSDTFRVTPLDPLLISDLVVDVVYPGYLGREAERFEGDVPPLELPVGTTLTVRGRATRKLGEAVLQRGDGSSRIALEVTADRFVGRWTPRSSGVYHWHLTDRTGGGLASAPPPLEITIVEDAAPTVDITFPGVDTVLGPSMQQVIVADARDDHGLVDARLVSWRVSALGGSEAPVEEKLALEGDAERGIVRGILDATRRGLLPGDEIHYHVRVTDNSPRCQTAISPTYVLRLPGLTELRERAESQTEAMVADAEALTQSAKELEQSTRELARRSANSRRGGASASVNRSGRSGRSGGSEGGSPGGQENLGYQEVEQARQLLDRQESMVRRVEEMRERTAALERAMQEAGLQDPALQERLREIRELYDQVLSPELKEQMEELRRSLDQMDPEEVQRALEQLAQRQAEFRQQVEQSLELLRRAAAEQEMNALAREAQELATQQQALAEAMKREGAPSPERIAQQQELSRQADALQRALESLAQKLGKQGETQAAAQAGQAGQSVEQARRAMDRAAQQARQPNGAQAGQQAGATGQQAAAELEQAAKTLESARESMAQAWRDEVQESVQQAANEALALAQRQNELLEQMREAQRQQDQAGRQQGASQGQPSSGEQGQQQGAREGQTGSQGERPQQGKDPQQGQQGQGSQQGQQGQQGRQGQSGQQGQSGEQGQSGKQGRQGKQGGGAGQRGDQAGGQVGPTGQRPSGQSGQGGQGGQGNQGNQGPEGNQGHQSGEMDLQSLRSEQAALQQGLEALGRNLEEAGRRSAMVDREVGAALGRAMLSMQQTLEAMGGRDGQSRMPIEEAEQTVEALNRLALSLLANSEKIEQAQSGTGLQEALQQLAELAKQQGALNGQTNSLLPLELGPQAMGAQMQRLAQTQRDIAKKLGGMNDMTGGSDDLLGELDALAREAEEIARELGGGRLTPELLARQERLFHRLLDAGRTLEREEYSDERVGERPGDVAPSLAPALDAALLNGGPRYPVPGPEALRALPPAYRKLILEYFDRLNRREAEAGSRRGGGAAERESR